MHPACSKKRCIGYLICIVVVFTIVLYQEQAASLPRYVANRASTASDIYQDSLPVRPKPEIKIPQLEQQQEQQFQQQEQERVMGALDTACPSPLSPPPLELSEDLDLSECEEQTSAHSDFKISICALKERKSCNSFSVVIERRDMNVCQDSIDLPISTSSEEARMIRRRLGPDSFEVSISGAQALSAVIPYKYNEEQHPCRYIYPITLSNSGNFNIQVNHMFSRYQHFSEILDDPATGELWTARGSNWKQIPRKLRLHNRRLLAYEGLSSTALSSKIRCTDSCRLYSFPERSSSLPTGSVRTLEGAENLPLCSRTDDIPGAYLPDPSPIRQNEEVPHVPYRFQPLGCRLDPASLALLDGVNGKLQRQQCFTRAESKRVIFQGDSHVRMLYDSIIPRLLGDGDDVPIYEKAKNKTHVLGPGLTFDFKWDPHLYYLIGEEDSYATDVLLLSTGSHQARKRHSTSTYLKSLTSALNRALDMYSGIIDPPEPKVIYLSVPSKTPQVYQWRTQTRLENWSARALDSARNTGFSDLSYINGFWSSLPFSRLSPDKIHFRDLPPQEAWLMILLHQMDLCGS